MLSVLPGDVVVVRTGGWAAKIIRFGEMLQGKPGLHNHVAVLHHITPEHVAWFLEGRPSGLGWHTERIGLDEGYLSSSWTITNAAQPKTGDQREAVCAAMRELMGAPYDWDAIAADAAAALHMPEIWSRWGGQMPGHVVCSSSAAWAYKEAGMPAPEVGNGRFTEPADWDEFIAGAGWVRPVSSG